MKGRAPMAYQVSEAFGVSKTFKVPRNCHCFQDSNALQTTNKFPIGKFPIHPNEPTSDLPKNKIKENRNCLLRSSPNLEIYNLSWIWNLGGTNKTRLTGEQPGMRGRRGLTVRHQRKKQAGSVPRVL